MNLILEVHKFNIRNKYMLIKQLSGHTLQFYILPNKMVAMWSREKHCQTRLALILINHSPL